MSNQNDLVIVRRGDVEALKQEAIFGVFRRDAVEWDKLNALLANAPAIEQGEAVIDKAAYDGAREDLSIWKRRALEAEEKVRKYDQRIVDIGVIAMTPVTTPQQAQSVADALEEAAKICDDNLLSWADNEWNDAVKDCAKRIRALIKRNADYDKLSEVKHDTE